MGVIAAKEQDKRVVGKYIELTTKQVFNGDGPGPSDNFPEPLALIPTIQRVLDQSVSILMRPPVLFSLVPKSISANTRLLSQASFDSWGRYEHCCGSMMQPGSEFRSPRTTLSWLFGQHPNCVFF